MRFSSSSSAMKVDRVHVQVGEQYQAEIPSFTSRSNYSLFQDNPHYSSDEKASFFLGLYIFGKNFNEVKRFVGNNKTMGDIQAFYYGKFYKSDRYRKWHAYMKMKSKSYKNVPKIFTRPGQQEFLSRLLPNVPEECHSNLLKVSKTFAKGKMSLKEYVSTLKAFSVGSNALVEAFGIGTEKDLTDLTAYSGRSTLALPLTPETAIGKHYARLTLREITHILTGSFRLSKARSCDLFWEAVWPRLLVRGWHSEKLCGNSDDAVIASMKPLLLFFVPGVDEFSRTLVKGTHYFDSVHDILTRVASDPELIKLQPFQSVAPDDRRFVVPPQAKRHRTCRAKRNFDGAAAGFLMVNPGARQEEGSSCADNSEPIGNVAAGKYVCPRVNQEKARCSLLNHLKHQPDIITRRRSTRTTQPTIRLLESLDLYHPETKDTSKVGYKDYHHKKKLTSRPSQCKSGW